MSKIYLLSSSQVKLHAVQMLNLVKNDNIVTVNVNDKTIMPEQPISFNNSGILCAKKRVEMFKNSISAYPDFDPFYDMIISIENFVDVDTFTDISCFYVVINGYSSYGLSTSTNPLFPPEYIKELGEQLNFSDIYGYNKTIGEIVKLHNPECESNNWGKTYCSFDRIDQIVEAYKMIDKKELLKSQIRYVKDHPIEGVYFSDLSPIFSNLILKSIMYNLMCESIIKVTKNIKIDYVVGLDARGFISGSAMAEFLNAGFVTIRKIGKLGGNDCYSEKYGKEYGKDEFEIVHRAMKKGKNILIIDDIIATGGTIEAAKKLCDKFEPEHVFSCVIGEIEIFREIANNRLGDFYKNVVICL